MSYRDERDALRHRIEQLEEQLAERGDDDDREELRREVKALSKQVANATKELVDDRAALSQLDESLAKLNERLGGDKPAEAKRVVIDVEGSRGARNSKATVLALAALAAVVGLGATLAFALKDASPQQPSSQQWQSPIPGAPHAVDPLDVLPLASRRVPGSARLMRIKAFYVSPDGRVDLDGDGYRGHVEYEFVGTAPEAAATPKTPLGVPKPRKPAAPVHKVTLTAAGLESSPTVNMGGILGDQAPPVRAPRCSLAQVWAAAKGAGAPDAVAVLEYSAGTKSIMTPLPEGVVGWTLEITGTDYKYRIDDATCQLLP